VTEAAKQVGMNEAQLRELNSIPKGMLIKPGSALLVPRAADAHLDVTETIADRGQVSFTPEIVQVRKTMRARKGDSVESIARRYTTSAANVAQWNKVASNATFKAGQSVVVYVSASAAGSKAEKSPQSASRSSEKPKAHPAAKKAEAVTAKRAKA
jgi:membrane-bound lytic murein transglycosylase D